MKIVKPGRVPVFTHRGACELCGCQVECEQAEVSSAGKVPCPTPMCGQMIALARKPAARELDAVPPLPAPAPGHESGFYDGYR